MIFVSPRPDLAGPAVVPVAQSPLLLRVERESGQHITRCYQCGKCAAGCPAAFTMDLTPRQVIRALQLGLRDLVLGSSAIWVCLSCQACGVRCPVEIDIPRVMDTLRSITLKEKVSPAEKKVALFHRLFLEGIEKGGRAHELSLGLRYNLRSQQPFFNARRLPSMLRRGKLPLRSHRVGRVRELFEKVAEQDKSGKA